MSVLGEVAQIAAGLRSSTDSKSRGLTHKGPAPDPALEVPLSLPPPMKSDPALDFILAQTKQNIQFLISQGAIDKEDGAVIVGKLDLSAAISQSTQQFAAQSLQTEDSAVERTNTPVHKPPSYSEKISSSPEICTSILSSGTPLFTVKALWGYNEGGKVGQPPGSSISNIYSLHTGREGPLLQKRGYH